MVGWPPAGFKAGAVVLVLGGDRLFGDQHGSRRAVTAMCGGFLRLVAGNGHDVFGGCWGLACRFG